MGRYRNRLWSICFRVTGNREDAEEAVQDTLTSAWQNLHKFRGEAKVSTWLYRIAANSSLAVVRKRKRKETVADLDVIELEDPAPLTADRVADVDAVGRALAELPDSTTLSPDGPNPTRIPQLIHDRSPRTTDSASAAATTTSSPSTRSVSRCRRLR